MFLSLCMIVKNEEVNIKECLDKALEIVDEAIIVDTGSTDETRNILKQYEKIDKVKVLNYTWENDFSKARNKSIENAKGDYILILDADERIFCNRELLNDFLLHNRAKAYTLSIFNVYENKEMTVSNSMIRLYKNHNPKYSGAIHEQLELDGKKYLGENINEGICKIYHFGYSKEAFLSKNKQKRNMDIIISEIEKNPSEPFNWYNKGVMEMIAGNLDNAIEDFIKSHSLCKGKRMAYHNDLVIRMIQCMLLQKKYKQSINFINALKQDIHINNMPDMYYYLGYAYKETKKYDHAITSFKKAIEIGDQSIGISKFGAGSYLPLIEWASILKKKKNIVEAIGKYKEALFHPSNINNQGYSELRELLILENKIQEIEEIESKIHLKIDKGDTGKKKEQELQEYKIKFKKNIQSFIEEGKIDNAKKMIIEYEKIISDDIDIYSFKGILAMLEGNIGYAESLFIEGLEINKLNFDLLYNLAYLYQSQNQIEAAIEFYKRSCAQTKEQNQIDEINEILHKLEVQADKNKLMENKKIIDTSTAQCYEENNELENYMRQCKHNIQLLIENALLEDAKNMVKEYEKIVKDDIDMYSVKSVIAMMQGELRHAENILLQGLNIDKENFDLLCNIAYLYQSQGNKKLAIGYYKKALLFGKIETNRNEVYELLKKLGVTERIEEILENYEFENYYFNAIKFEKEGNKSDAALNYGLAYRNSKDKGYKKKSSIIFKDNKSLENIYNVAANSLRKRFVILSSCGWGDIYQRMHHISRSLVKFGHEVIYISPARNVDINDKSIEISELTKHTLENIKMVDGVSIYTPIIAMHNKERIAINYTDLVQNLLDSSTENSQTVIITYMPYQVEILNSLKGKFMHIYECVDDHSDLEYAFWGHKKDILWEQELMDKADAITTTATSLFLQRRAIEGRENVYLSRNAVNESDFILIGDEKIPKDLKDIPEPRICYVGAVYEWFDTKLFYEVVKSNPHKSFVIIGFGKEGILTEKCSNLYILGSKKHSELKNYLKYMDIGIIPFKENTDIIINCDPIKQYEYIACGLPVITTFMPETAIDKINTFLANTKEDFNKAIEKCLHLEIDKDIVTNFLGENSWNARAALLCRIADGKITKEERYVEINSIRENLDRIALSYDSPIFQTLKAVYFNINNSEQFKVGMKKIYDREKTKYIEKQYVRSLLIIKKAEEFVTEMSGLVHMSDELMQELNLCIQKNDLKCLEIIANIYVGNIFKVLSLIDKLTDINFKKIYKVYIMYILGGEIRESDLDFIHKNPLHSNLANFIKERGITKNYSIKNRSITVLIPTKDRPELLERCVTYFHNINCDKLSVNLMVLDASNTQNKYKNKAFLSRHGNGNIQHFGFDEKVSILKRFLEVYDKIDNEFFCMCADDDFIYKDGIIKAIDVLSSNRDVITVKGKSYIFLNNNTDKIYYFPKDSCVPLLDDNPVDRLDKLVKQWVPQFYYLVYRKNDFLEIVLELLVDDEYKISADVFEEYALYFMVILSGKVINIEETLSIRDETPTSGGNRSLGFYGHVLNMDFNKHYKEIKSKLTIFCYKNNIELKDDYLEKIFTEFLTNSWGIPKEYITILNSEFDLDILKRGFEYARLL